MASLNMLSGLICSDFLFQKPWQCISTSIAAFSSCSYSLSLPDSYSWMALRMFACFLFSYLRSRSSWELSHLKLLIGNYNFHQNQSEALIIALYNSSTNCIIQSCWLMEPQFYAHFQDNRAPSQIQLANNLARALTSLNIKRIQQNKQSFEPRGVNRKDLLYVCFTGLPPIAEEFDQLGIVGEKMIIYPQGYQPGITEEQAKAKIECSQIQQQVEIIHKRLRGRTDKKMVFIYHSFGTTLMSTLFRLYYAEYVSRVIGLIGIGAYPIRFPPDFKTIQKSVQIISKQFLLENADELYRQHVDQYSKKKLVVDKNKYVFICRTVAFCNGIGFKQMFSFIRQLPPVLKCIIYGSEDNRINEEFLNEAAIYYCYKRKLQPQYEDKVRSFLKDRYKINADNAQQRFVYRIEGGKHSVHIQKRFKTLLGKIIDEYLSTIQSIHTN